MIKWSYMRGQDTLDIKLGYSCNNRCVHCVVEPVKLDLLTGNKCIDLSTAEIIETLKHASSLGIKSVVITGGEPTLREDFFYLINFAVEKKLKVIIQSNGRMLSRIDFCKKLKGIPGLQFIIAIHGASREIHDAITREKESFTETTLGIKNLIEIGQPVTTKIVLTKLNYECVFETANISRELGVNKFCVVYPHLPGKSRNLIRNLAVKYSQMRDCIKKLAEYSETNKFEVSFETIPFCICDDSEAFWYRNCDLKSKVLNLGKENISMLEKEKNLFNWEKLRPSMKIRPEICSFCAFNLICEGVWIEYAQTFGLKELKPINIKKVKNIVNF